MFTPISFYGQSDLNVYDDVYALFDASIASSISGGTWTAATSSLDTAPVLTRDSTNITYTSSGSASYWTFYNTHQMSGNVGVNSFGYRGGFTLNMWMMPSTFDVAPSGQAAYWIDAQSGNDFGYRQSNRYGSWAWYAANSDTGAGGGSTGQFPSGANTDWWMNTITWDGVTTTGRMKGTSNFSTTFSYTAAPTAPGFSGNTILRLGILDKSATTLYWGSGKIAMVEMWNRGLTAEEVETIWDTNKSRFGY